VGGATERVGVLGGGGVVTLSGGGSQRVGAGGGEGRLQVVCIQGEWVEGSPPPDCETLPPSPSERDTPLMSEVGAGARRRVGGAGGGGGGVLVFSDVVH
jgi:hypothetical protein